MASLCRYLLVQMLVILGEISRTSSQSCGSNTIELKASPENSLNLTSPNYPSDYPPSQDCSWRITAPAGYVVELTFLDINIGSIHNTFGCSDTIWFKDYLEIYDDHYGKERRLLGRYCSTYLPPKVFSSSLSLVLVFKSDDLGEQRGFKLEYTATVPKPDRTICSPFNTFDQNNNIQLSGSSGYIESPLYGTKYPSNMQCTWVITIPEGKNIKLTFLDFKLGYASFFCQGKLDIVEIRDGQFNTSELIGRYCSSSKPSPVYSTGKHLWIRFISNVDNYIDRESGKDTNGFRARYEEDIKSLSIGAIIGIAIAVYVVVVIIIIVICYRRRRRPASYAQASQPVTQTTLTYNQNPTSATSYPAVHYSPAPQSSYPPPSSGHPSPRVSYQQPQTGSYPMSTTGDTPQPSAPVNDHPYSTLQNNPPPSYPEIVPDVPPPFYPEIPPNPSHVPTTKPLATS